MPAVRQPGRWRNVPCPGPNRAVFAHRPLLLLLFLASMLPGRVSADTGDWSLGVAGAVGVPDQHGIPLRLGLLNRLGLSDWFSAELAVGFEHREQLGLQGEVGLVASADIFQWVPDLVVSCLVDYSPEDGSSREASIGFRTKLRGRYFLSMKSAVSVAVGLTWLGSEPAPFVAVGWSRMLN